MKLNHYEDLEALAITLPDAVDFYRRSGDFDGELACIEKMLKAGGLTPSMQTRLELEQVIARGMREDYRMDRAAFLTRLQAYYPACDDATVDRLLYTGHLDTILRGGELHFQNAAVSNARNCCKKLLEENEHPGTMFVYPEDTLLRENDRIMREQGGRAFRYRVRMSLTVDEEAQRAGKRIRVWLPVPAKCAEQSDIVIHAATENVRLSGGKQPTAYFEELYTPGREYFVEFSYTHRMPYFDLRTADVCDVQPRFYLDEMLPHIYFTPTMRALAREIRGDERNPLLVARRIYDYITANVKYSYMREYLLMENIPEFCAVNRRGDCGVQALLFITLCRILGIPARWQSGNAVKPTGSIGSHDWAMFHVAPWGWLYADPSYGGGAYRRGDELLRAHYFGNLDPFRMVCATEFQQPFSPAKSFLRDDPYDNQSGEAEWEDMPLPVENLTRRKVLIESQELPF